MAKRRSPSLAGVGAATQVFSWHIVRPVAQNWRSQRFVPSFALKQMTCNRSCFGPLEHVTNTRSPMMIGLLKPRPGRSAAQAMLFVSILFGSNRALAMPLPFGPRKSGQPCSAKALRGGESARATVTEARSERVRARVFMAGKGWVEGGEGRWGQAMERRALLVLPSNSSDVKDARRSWYNGIPMQLGVRKNTPLPEKSRQLIRPVRFLEGKLRFGDTDAQ